MTEYKYLIYYIDNNYVIAETNDLNNASIILKAMMQEYYSEPEMAIAIKRAEKKMEIE